MKGSLCTGTGALDAATPGEPAWVAETDADASLVLKREHPDAENLGDITTLLQRTTTTVDDLTSGDPCQSMSLAGQRKARADVRFLWPYVNEIIREMRPREVFLENVQGLVSLEGGALLRLRLDDLRAAGYAVRWTVLGACAVGAPHHRHRWFARAVHVGTDAPEAERVITRCGAPRPAKLLPTPMVGDATGGHSEPEIGGVRPSGAKRMDSLPTVARVHALGWGRHADAIARWEQITGRPAPAPVEPAHSGVGVRLNAELSEWMMGMRRGLVTDGFARNAALKMAGNGVVTLQARTAHELLAPR